MSGRSVIAAAATPHGRGAVALVRVSGPGLGDVLRDVVVPKRRWAHGRARRVELRDRRGPFDDGLATWFVAPRSYTGEDVCEIGQHGNPALVARLLDALQDAGARIARPGEFTRRAVLAGKLDLLRAEAVDQLVRATGAEGLRVARDGASGRLGSAIGSLRTRLVDAAAELEARLDWPGDELAFETDEQLVGKLLNVVGDARSLASTYEAGRVRVEGASVALVGPVNAGKSSLFNALLGEQRAIVHASPGTTRDVVEARLQLGELEVTLYDTAGERATDDPIEALGLALGRRVVNDADLAVVVLRSGGPAEAAVLDATEGRLRVIVTNGADEPGFVTRGGLPVSARTGQGLDALRAAIRQVVAGDDAVGLLLASPRQRDLLLGVARAAEEAVAALPVAGVAVAADRVVAALEELDALTGASTREDVLDALFARFCIGK